MEGLSPEALEQVATYFQGLSEPTRLQILNELRGGERNVGELAAATGFSMANVSRHLSFLTQRGMIERETRGTAAYYRIADPAVFKLCDIVCGSIARTHERRALGAADFVRPARPARKAR